MSEIINAWLITVSQDTSMNRFHISLPKRYQNLDNIDEGDFLVFAQANELTSFARVFRMRENISEWELYFDGFLDASHSVDLSQFAIKQSHESPIIRLDFSIFEKMLEASCLTSHKNFPVYSGERLDEQNHLRNLLRLAVIDDLLGPAGGPHEEIIEMSVRDRYLVGKLAPISNDGSHTTEEPYSIDSAIDEDLEIYANNEHISFDKHSNHVDHEDNEEKEVDSSVSQILVPSAMGITFYVDSKVSSILLSASWGHYERAQSEKAVGNESKPSRCWKRIPCGGSFELPLAEGKIEPTTPDIDYPHVVLRGSIS